MVAALNAARSQPRRPLTAAGRQLGRPRPVRRRRCWARAPSTRICWPRSCARGSYDAIAVGHNELALDAATLDALLPRAGVRGTAAARDQPELRCAPPGLRRHPARPHLGAAARRSGSWRRSPLRAAGPPAAGRGGPGLADPVTAIREGVTRLRKAGRHARRRDHRRAARRPRARRGGRADAAADWRAGAGPAARCRAGRRRHRPGRRAAATGRHAAAGRIAAGTRGISRVRWTDGRDQVDTLRRRRPPTRRSKRACGPSRRRSAPRPRRGRWHRLRFAAA